MVIVDSIDFVVEVTYLLAPADSMRRSLRYLFPGKRRKGSVLMKGSLLVVVKTSMARISATSLDTDSRSAY